MEALIGIGVSPGVALGVSVIPDRAEIRLPYFAYPGDAFVAALAVAAEHLRVQARTAVDAGRQEAGDILNVQALMVEDPMLADSVSHHLGRGDNLEQALDEAVSTLSELLVGSGEEVMAERSVDLAEAVDAIRRALAGVGEPSSAVMDEPGVLIVDELSVAEAARLQPDLVLGIITRGGGPTGHVAIVARSLGIPAVVGVTDLSPTSYVGSRVAMDGTTGEVFIEPDSVVWADYRQRQDDYQQAIVLASRYRGTRIRCLDRELHVAANVGGLTDIELAQTQGADGIGLFRTEFLFQDRDGPPTEEEQFEIYAVAASAFSLPVVCRTFDFGGDKPISYLPLPDEENPALGLRGIRLYKEFKELFRTQVRALLRAATKGDIQILLPMVSTVDEFCEIRAEIESVRDALIADHVPVGPAVVGAMVEVPAAAFCSHLLARHADFLSIGTNDLTQYTMAADRTNGSLVEYSDALHPAVFELTRLSVESAKAAGIPISVCGLSAADPIASALYVASGVDKLSVQSSQVNLVKANLAEMDVGQVVPALRQAAGCANAAELRQMAEDLVTPR